MVLVSIVTGAYKPTNITGGGVTLYRFEVWDDDSSWFVYWVDHQHHRLRTTNPPWDANMLCHQLLSHKLRPPEIPALAEKMNGWFDDNSWVLQVEMDLHNLCVCINKLDIKSACISRFFGSSQTKTAPSPAFHSMARRIPAGEVTCIAPS